MDSFLTRHLAKGTSVFRDGGKMRSMSDKLVRHGGNRGDHTQHGFRDSGKIYHTEAERKAQPQAVRDCAENEHLVNGGWTKGDKLYVSAANGPKVPPKRTGKSPFKKYNQTEVVIVRK